MEFRYRAGEAPLSSYYTQSAGAATGAGAGAGVGYFTNQAMLAGYMGRRPEPDYVDVPNPLSRSMPRDLTVEKDRIREEILRKWELEEEVRRELAYERELALRRHFALPPDHRNPIFPPLPLPPLSRLSGLPLTPSLGALERLNYRATNGAGEERIDRIPEGAERNFALVGRSAQIPYLAGTKRKAAIEAQFAISKKVQKEWSCALCQVSATSEQGLNEHLQGKKHKAKEVELTGCNVAAPNRDGPEKKATGECEEETSPQIVQKVWACALCQVSATSEQGLNEHFQGRRHKAKVEELRERESVATDKGASHSTSDADKCSLVKDSDQSTEQQLKMEKKPFGGQFFCEYCKVKCNSEYAWEAHLGGKKHLTNMQKSERRKTFLVNKTALKDHGQVGIMAKDGCLKNECAMKTELATDAKLVKEEALVLETTDQVSSTDRSTQ